MATGTAKRPAGRPPTERQPEGTAAEPTVVVARFVFRRIPLSGASLHPGGADS